MTPEETAKLVADMRHQRNEQKRRAEAAESQVAELKEERQAVLDCINLYGDMTLHKALDDIGFAPRAALTDEAKDVAAAEQKIAELKGGIEAMRKSRLPLIDFLEWDEGTEEGVPARVRLRRDAEDELGLLATYLRDLMLTAGNVEELAALTDEAKPE